MTDMDILRRAYERENDSRDRRHPDYRNWEYFTVGASRDDIRRLLDEGFLIVAAKTTTVTKYKLSEKGRQFVWAINMEHEFTKIPASNIIDAMELIVGFEDVKQTLARAISNNRRAHFLLEGPPASIHGDTEVWVDLGDGPRSLPIVALEGKRFRALSIHPQNLKSGWYEAEVSTHDYNGEWVEITGVGVLPFSVTATHSLVAYDPVNGCLIPRKAGELKVGELLPVASQWHSRWLYTPSGNTVLVNRVPLDLDKELGFVLGFWLGGGGLAQEKNKLITFSNHSRPVLERIQTYLASIKGATTYRGGHLRRDVLRVQHRPFFDFLKREFLYGDGKPGIKGRTSRWKKLPPWVMQGPEDFACELLNGYFYADGTAANGVISATTTSPKLAGDMAMLLTRLGITPGIQRRGHDAQTVVIRQCDAQRFMDKVGVFRENKNVSTSILMHDESFKVPFPFDARAALSLTAALRKGRRSQSLTRRAATELLAPVWPQRLAGLLSGDIRWVRVEHVRRFSEPGQVVYDLSVPGAETFVLGNRVLVHNCAKSLMLEGIRSAVPGAFPSFGSRTSAAGLSQVLFEFQPSVLLLDEADKMRADCFSVLLGLMESGEILETKSQKCRGIKLQTMVVAACNSSAKFPPEFLSRFALHVYFPSYTRDEFIEVCQGFLSKAENCPPDIAGMIGQAIFDNKLGDVRRARGVWMLMTEPTREEMLRVINMMVKYSPELNRRERQKQGSRFPGI